MAMPNLPDEIIADIVLRLPVTSLCRFRCVSKPWLSLISDPHFIKSHLNRNTNEHQHDRLILVSKSFIFHSVDLKSFQCLENFVAVRLNFPPNQHPSLCREIWGSCDGLLLMLNRYSSYFLVNPSIRQSRKLPKSPFSIESKFCLHCCGLGYDSSNDDYKVVRISHYDYDCNNADNIVSVYTLRTNSWRRIQDSPYVHSVFGSSPGILVSGALHWLASNNVGSRKADIIASFDLADENFRDVPSPVSVDDFSSFQVLRAVGGCLCVIVCRDGGCYDVLVMKEYGVRDSWTKFTINYGDFSVCNPLCLSTAGEFLLEMNGFNSNKLLLFNPREQIYKELTVKGSRPHFEAGTYVESLVSPNCSNMIKSQYQAPHKRLPPDRALQAWTEAWEAKTKANLSKAKRYRLNEPSSSKSDRFSQ